jgi:hypothetical protein
MPPANGLQPEKFIPLQPAAPGLYRVIAPVAAQTIYRLALYENKDMVEERFVSTPYPLELRRFGTDRAFMQELVKKAGGGSTVIETPRDLKRYAAAHSASRVRYSLRPWLLLAGLMLLLTEYGLRAARAKKIG